MNAANDDPDGNAIAFEFNLRFPGQYFDRETGLHYNFYRDYDVGTGRYSQSDPVGLAAGPNTYAYGWLNPLRNIDMFGLDVFRSGNSYSDVPFIGPSCRKAIVAGGGIVRWIPCGDPPGPPATSGTGFGSCYPGSPPADPQPPTPPLTPPQPPVSGGAGSPPPAIDPKDPRIERPDEKFAKCMAGKMGGMLAMHVALKICAHIPSQIQWACIIGEAAKMGAAPGLTVNAVEECKVQANTP